MMDEVKPTPVATCESQDAVRPPASNVPPTLLGLSISTPTLVLLWTAIHVLVVLEPAPVHPFLPRFLSSRIWFEIQSRFRLAPSALALSTTQETLRWAAAGPRQSATWALRYTADNRRDMHTPSHYLEAEDRLRALSVFPSSLWLAPISTSERCMARWFCYC
ncbi:hypothetical protein CspeluHIS016_0602900 [Cutaneotrichosporon spelunceum]|uniref:Uncharacterized protein n=1 Tax=Cutaneotrichosporon spelunceum TaxID=1672016 RepID=A0AAD3TY11_9TREE|nr:hypothetical protein CspeluHIS016_0602900 [Cutaneotrichosporon spelunceum]